MACVVIADPKNKKNGADDELCADGRVKVKIILLAVFKPPKSDMDFS
jgi:hypothetical protein